MQKRPPPSSLPTTSTPWRSLRGLPGDQASRRLATLRDELAAIEDPRVVVEPGDYWQVTLVQVEEGLLKGRR